LNGGEYAVFRCPNCGCYTFAPTAQKNRLCSRCGRIVKVDLLHAEIVSDARRASELVKYHNAKNAPPKLKEALKEQLMGSERKTQRMGTRSSTLLMKVLAENCSEEITLDELEELCKKHGLDCEWVKAKLPQLALKSLVFFPSPWTVKCAAIPHSSEEPSKSGVSQTASLSKVVMEAFSIPASRAKVIKQLAEKGYPPEKVDELIDKLHKSGLIIEEKPGIFKRVD